MVYEISVDLLPLVAFKVTSPVEPALLVSTVFETTVNLAFPAENLKLLPFDPTKSVGSNLLSALTWKI